MKKLNLDEFKLRCDVQHLKPVFEKINDMFLKETIRLGMFKIQHTQGNYSLVSGTTEVINDAAFYTPIRNMKILKAYFITNFTSTNLGEGFQGYLKVSKDPLSESDQIVIPIEYGNEYMISESYTSFGGMGFAKEDPNPIMYEALTTQYFIAVQLADTIEDGIYILLKFILM